MEDPRKFVFPVLEAMDPGVKMVETVSFKIPKEKSERFTSLMTGLVADTRKNNKGAISFDLHRQVPPKEGFNEYLLHEVWENRDALRRHWEAEYLKVFQGKLMSENLMVGPPDLRFFLF